MNKPLFVAVDPNNRQAYGNSEFGARRNFEINYKTSENIKVFKLDICFNGVVTRDVKYEWT